MKETNINTDTLIRVIPMVEVVRQRWRGVVFPYVQYLETDQGEWADTIPIKPEIWRECFPNVKKVHYSHVPLLDDLTIQP